jgi:Uma2 family endonuclease
MHPTAPAIPPFDAAGPRPARVSPWSAEDLAARLGDIPLRRIRFDPPPGTADKADAVRATETERPCELIDGTLVEKTVGAWESRLAALLIELLGAFARRQRLGVVFAPDATMELARGQDRIPNVSFVSWARLPADRTDPVPAMVPDLAVEIIGEGNTRREMDRKRAEYLSAGVRLLWYVHPATRTVEVFTPAAPDAPRTLREGDALDGGEVLQGFSLPVAELFAEPQRP